MREGGEVKRAEVVVEPAGRLRLTERKRERAA